MSDFDYDGPEAEPEREPEGEVRDIGIKNIIARLEHVAAKSDPGESGLKKVRASRVRRSRSQEREWAQRINARRVPGSGNNVAGLNSNDKLFEFGPGVGDVEHELFLTECKRTDAKSVRLSEEPLSKIQAEARSEDKIPLVHVEIGGIRDPMCARRYVLLTESDFLFLLNQIDSDGSEGTG